MWGCGFQALNGGLAIEETGFQFLEDLSKQATVREEGNGALVLGFNSPDGAKAMLDFTLGKVPCCPPKPLPSARMHAERSPPDM